MRLKAVYCTPPSRSCCSASPRTSSRVRATCSAPRCSWSPRCPRRETSASWSPRRPLRRCGTGPPPTSRGSRARCPRQRRAPSPWQRAAWGTRSTARRRRAPPPRRLFWKKNTSR
ncbi:hypothetical protein PVAP13_1NG285119 [Panicum virgatum]|uniref:Uncharacterized protein n=1 Tax=Panicum virgatum TaxID=38727 RepID=A0A8T0X0P1_PANVG|nr:hypothetical protein PVAP13_1NG285119 [Panicum virgatum]